MGAAADMTWDPQSKQSFQTDYHSCLFEEWFEKKKKEKMETADGGWKHVCVDVQYGCSPEASLRAAVERLQSNQVIACVLTVLYK